MLTIGWTASSFTSNIFAMIETETYPHCFKALDCRFVALFLEASQPLLPSGLAVYTLKFSRIHSKIESMQI
jgi:hypothetical protein